MRENNPSSDVTRHEGKKSVASKGAEAKATTDYDVTTSRQESFVPHNGEAESFHRGTIIEKRRGKTIHASREGAQRGTS